MLRVRWIALGISAMALLAAGSAHAAEPVAAPPTYTLAWVRGEGADGCPPGRTLIAEVERRLGRAVFDTTAERSFEVEVTHFGNTYRSDVFVHDDAGHTLGHRTLESDEPECAELVNATALAIALLIDPEAAAREPAPAKSSVAFVEPTPPPPPPPPVVALPPPLPALVVPPRDEPRPPPPFDTIRMSLRGQLSVGLLPAASPGAELMFSARTNRRWGFALTGAYGAPQNVKLGVGSIDVGLTRAALLGTFEASRADAFRLVLAGGPSLGAFHVAVREPAPITAPGDYWFGALELAADLQFIVTPELFLDVGGSGFVPLRRQQFVIRGQDEPVWSQSWFSGVFFFGVGTMFP